MISGGKIVVSVLEAHGVDRIFCVPGESYLPVLDALKASSIDVVVARHEGGAAIMAEADGKLTRRAGVVFTTRGPGATNGASGVHIAQQDSTPLLFFIGQVARDMRGRDAFQEINYQNFYGGIAKAVFEVDAVEDLSTTISKGFHLAISGRPGPVVISLPEDMLYDEVASPKIKVLPSPISPTIPVEIKEKAQTMLAKAQRPIIIAGGSCWNDEAILNLETFAQNFNIPIACSFRRQGLCRSTSPFYAGDLGLGCNPALVKRIKNADLLLLLGGRLSEIASQSYSLLDIPEPQMPLIHVHPDIYELGRVYTPSLAIESHAGDFIEAMLASQATEAPSPTSAPILPEHESYRTWSDTVPDVPGDVNMAVIMHWLREYLPSDAIMTNGAGNYATWLHRYYHYRHPQSQLAPTSGSMGYGIPAAIAAKARYPERPVLAFAGDGCMQMTMQEMATARQIGANIIILVIDNGMYGTIRMHQERIFPSRIAHTELVNPDFVNLARAMGFYAEKVSKTIDFKEPFINCMNAKKPALLHIQLDPEAITPAESLTSIRAKALASQI